MHLRRPLLAYFLLAYFFSWIIFILLALNRHQVIHLFPDDAAHARTQDLWHAFGALGPSISAVMLLWFFSDSSYRETFQKRYALRMITPRGWWMALSPLIFFFIAITIEGLITGHWFSPVAFFQKNDLSHSFHFIAWLMPSVFYGIFEEAGWRGFALPTLQQKYSAITATTILTAGWIGWHVPSFFYRYTMNGPMLIGFVLGIFAGAIFLTCLFNMTRGSILAVSIWHLTYDLVSMTIKEGMVPAIVSTLIMLSGILVWMIYKGKNLSAYARIDWKATA